jgi:hypothetical protein
MIEPGRERIDAQPLGGGRHAARGPALPLGDVDGGDKRLDRLRQRRIGTVALRDVQLGAVAATGEEQRR